MGTPVIETISPQTVKRWVAEDKPFILIDTLTNDHFKAIHLPGAHHACVFEMTFLDQVTAITTDKHARLVLYGASEKSMDAIENKSLAGDESQPVLISHLKSDDFFFTRLFPTATFTIQSGTPRNEPYVSTPNVDVQGELTLRGVKAGLSFPATVYQALDGTITAKARFDLDRTRWNIIYGSTRFFEHLGMHLVFDIIHIEVKIVARRKA